jgi:hypothetical protein
MAPDIGAIPNVWGAATFPVDSLPVFKPIDIFSMQGTRLGG